MHIILSRKGFDSANGGIVSPIFPDNQMISFPIPCADDNDCFSELVYNGTDYLSIMNDLHYKGSIEKCHLDPDLDRNRRKNKPNEWIPLFGQCGAAASYLFNGKTNQYPQNYSVEKDDIFLFFGNFHRVEYQNGHYCYVKRTGDFYADNDLQIIWGYLQVGEIILGKDVEIYKWHPHSIRIDKKHNTIFKASSHLSFDQRMPGAGLLLFAEKRVLTKKDAHKATWILNPVYDTDNIIGTRKNCAGNPNEGIYYKGIWQELKLKESAACEEWAKSIIL